MDAAANRFSASACSDLLSSVAKAPLSISQSGQTLVVSLNAGNTGAGTLSGRILKAQFPGVVNPTAADCSDRGLTLSATLDPNAEPRILSGTLSVQDCDTCAPLEFRAERQPRSAAGGSH